MSVRRGGGGSRNSTTAQHEHLDLSPTATVVAARPTRADRADNTRRSQAGHHTHRAARVQHQHAVAIRQIIADFVFPTIRIADYCISNKLNSSQMCFGDTGLLFCCCLLVSAVGYKSKVLVAPIARDATLVRMLVI